MNYSFSKIWIPIILIILAGWGIFAWQYFGVFEKELTQPEITKWKEYKFEEISQDFKSPDFYDRRLIGIHDSGQRDVIVSSVKELMGWEEADFYPREVSFPAYSSKIFFVKHRAETAHSAGFFMLNVVTLESKELTKIGPIYENYYNYLSLVSPDGFKIASYGNNDLYLLDLVEDEAVLLAKAQIGEMFYLAAETPEFRWLDDNTVQYPVHSAQDIYAPPIEIRQISIDTKEVAKVVKDGTANWKTYQNKKFGFEIKYPEGTKITDIDAESGYFFMQLPFSPSGTKLGSKILRIHVAATEFNYGVEVPASCVSDDSIGSVVINGITFTKRDASGEFAGMEGAAVAIEYCAMKGNLAFKLIFSLGYDRYSQLTDFDREKESLIFNQILSTFRFLE